MRIRRFSFILTTIAILTLACAILLNLLYMKPLFQLIYDFREDILAYEVVLEEAKLPIGVLKNVTTQFEGGKVVDDSRRERLLDAYKRNQNALTINQNKVGLFIESLDYAFKQIKQMPMLDQSRIGQIEDRLMWLGEDSEKLEEMVGRMGGPGDENTLSMLNAIEEKQLALGLVTDQLLIQMASWNRQIVERYIAISNAVFGLLLTTVVLLGLFLSRLIQKDIGFMLEGFRRLSQYDTRKEALPKLSPIFEEEREVLSRVEEIFDEQNFLNELKEVSNQYYVLDDVLDHLFHSIQPIMAVDRLGVAFIEEDTDMITAEYAIGSYPIKRLKAGYAVPMASTSLREMAKDKCSSIEGDLRGLLDKRPESPSLRLIVEEGIQSNMIIPLLINDEVYGFLFFSSVHLNAYDEVSMRIGRNISHELSAMINKTFLMKKVFSTMTRTFARLVEEKDQVTGNHVSRMTAYAALLAASLIGGEREGYKVKPSFVRDIHNDASVHDIGKVAIPDSILKKPGRYTPEEFEAMKQHTKVGGEILSEMQRQLKHFKTSFYQVAIDIAKYHHERWDGSGYPEGLKGAEIPLSARIVAIADVFDALTSRRPYKEPFSFDDAVKIIKESSGTHFDPILVNEFLKLLPQIKRIYERSEDRF